MISVETNAYWIPVTFMFVLEWIFVWVYLKGLSFFPGMDLAEVLIQTTGKWAAFIILIPFVFYLLTDVVLMSRNIAAMVTMIFLPITPLWALLSFIAISIFCAMGGLPTILRSGMVFLVLFSPVLLFSFFSTVNYIDLHNALPITDWRFKFLTDHRFYASMFAISPFLFLGVVQSYHLKLFPKKWHGVLTFIGLLLLFQIAVYIPLLIFSKEAAVTFHFPFVLALDTVDLEWFLFDRITIFYIISVAIFSTTYGAMALWVVGTIVHTFCGYWRTHIYIAGFGLLNYVVTLLIPNFAWIERLTLLEIPLRMYCIAGVPAIVLILGLAQRRKLA